MTMEVSHSIASSVSLFKEVLCDKENNKLKKLQVKLKKLISNGGKTVFNLNIQGIQGHKCHLQLEFTEQELCFVRIEELQDNHTEPSCFQCFRRGNYSTQYYCRLVLLLYRETDEPNGESECVKVPLIQSGNIHAATTLRKLKRVIHNNISSTDNCQHWLVSVVTCGHLNAGYNVFFCLTKYAVAVVMCGQYQIMHYHPFYCTELSVTCVEEENIIKIDVVDRPRESHATENENFTFARQYVFRTSSCARIEKAIKRILRLSAMNPQGPSAHWNIRHSELSASGVVIPGTTSDNMMILPHRPHEFDNNNTGSSGSNGHIPSGKVSNLTLPPYHPYHQSGSGMNFSTGSNGPYLSNSSSNFPTDLSLEIQSSEELVPRGTLSKGKDALDSSRSQLDRQLSIQHDSLPPPCAHVNTGESTDPTRRNYTASSPYKSPTGFFEIDSVPMSSEPYWSFIEEKEDEELPPPPAPCRAQLQPHVNIEFKHKLPTPHSPLNQQAPDIITDSFPAESGQSSIMRSISYMDMTNLSAHSYVNVQYMMSIRRNVHDDNPYYRFYVNIGYVTTSKKLQRRNRMSKEMKEVDFNKLENHEEWFDIGFKEREKDLRFCRINKLNIKEPDNRSTYGYSHARPVKDEDDDPYWSSDLSLTLQKVLQDQPGTKSGLFRDTMDHFDLTREQLISVQVLLSLVPSNSNWKDMAEYIGLTSSDISVIQHFCFTYRELAASIVLIHWIRLHQKGKCDLDSNHENLRRFLNEIEREDLTNVLATDSARSNMMEDDVEETTHF